jgi:hypothetical protein
MNRMKRLAILILTAGSLAIGSASAANAQGFLGGIIDDLIPGLGTTLDQINDANGNVFDHAVAGIVGTVMPGATEAIELYYIYNRGGVPGLVEHELGVDGYDNSAPQPDDDADEDGE